MLVSHEDFVGDVTIASIDTLPVLELVKLFIEQREPEIMIDLFGVERYQQLLKINDSTMSDIKVKTSTSSNDTGIFYVNNSFELSLITQELNNISVENLINPLHAKSEPFGTDLPLLSDYIRNSVIDADTLVWMAFDAQDVSGSLGTVFINELFEAKLSSPELWGLTDTNILLNDLIALSDSKQAKIKSIGFMFDPSVEKQILSSINFNDQVFLFSDPVITAGILKKVKKIVAYFVWYWYSRHIHTLTTGSGEVRSTFENSALADASHKQTKNWNEMVNIIRGFVARDNGAYLHSHLWSCHHGYENKYSKINILNF